MYWVWLSFASAIGIFCLYFYGFKRVCRLEQRVFHLPMFCMLQIFSILIISANICGILFTEAYILDDCTAAGKLQNANTILVSCGWTLNMWVHCLFVMKYWVVAQKIRHVYEQKASNLDRRLNCVVWTLLIYCPLAIFTYQHVQYSSKTKPPLRVATGLAMDLPPYIFFGLLIHAFYIMNQHSEAWKIGISKRQIYLQLVSNFLYAFFDPFPTMVPAYTTLWVWFEGISFTTNIGSLFILTQTLCELVDLQKKNLVNSRMTGLTDSVKVQYVEASDVDPDRGWRKSSRIFEKLTFDEKMLVEHLVDRKYNSAANLSAISIEYYE